MIQRIQSVYLFLVVILTMVFMTGNIYSLNDHSGQVLIVGFFGSHPLGEMVPITHDFVLIIVTAAALLFSLSAVFLFKTRKIQSFLVVMAALMFLALSVLIMVKGMGLSVGSSVKAKFAFRAFLPFIILILLLLALRGIKKDEELVKSYDRLR
jgi:hypothetical protein